jgi:hypothetical protein
MARYWRSCVSGRLRGQPEWELHVPSCKVIASWRQVDVETKTAAARCSLSHAIAREQYRIGLKEHESSADAQHVRGS